MSLKTDYYRTVLLSIKRGQSKGVWSNAKPLYLLSIIQSIEDGLIIGNKFGYDAFLEHCYYEKCAYYEPQTKPALFFKPFYHSSAEAYYNIKWKGGSLPEHSWHTPSAKYLKDNIEYAYLDPDLWELLQDPASREELKESVIHHFLKKTL